MLNEKIKSPVTADKSISPKLKWINESRTRLRFTRSCLRLKISILTPKNIVNLFIVYELDKWSQDVKTKFSLKGCFFWSCKAN